MTRSASIDKKIVNYLDQLNVDQKKTVLSVAKALAEAGHESDIWEDDIFVAEMEKRSSDFKNGISKGYTWEEVKAETRDAIAQMKKK